MNILIKIAMIPVWILIGIYTLPFLLLGALFPIKTHAQWSADMNAQSLADHERSKWDRTEAGMRWARFKNLWNDAMTWAAYALFAVFVVGLVWQFFTR